MNRLSLIYCVTECQVWHKGSFAATEMMVCESARTIEELIPALLPLLSQAIPAYRSPEISSLYLAPPSITYLLPSTAACINLTYLSLKSYGNGNASSLLDDDITPLTDLKAMPPLAWLTTAA